MNLDYFIPFITSIKGSTFTIQVPGYSPLTSRVALLGIIKNPVNFQGEYGGNYVTGEIEGELKDYFVKKYEELKK